MSHLILPFDDAVAKDEAKALDAEDDDWAMINSRENLGMRLSID